MHTSWSETDVDKLRTCQCRHAVRPATGGHDRRRYTKRYLSTSASDLQYAFLEYSVLFINYKNIINLVIFYKHKMYKINFFTMSNIMYTNILGPIIHLSFRLRMKFIDMDRTNEKAGFYYGLYSLDEIIDIIARSSKKLIFIL